jgi:hypothetical protein
MTNTGFTFTDKVKAKMALGYLMSTSQVVEDYDLGWEGNINHFISPSAIV